MAMQTIKVDGSIKTSGGGGGPPGGTNRRLQFNNSSAFGGAEIDYLASGSLRKLKVEDQATDANGLEFSIKGSNGIGNANGGPITIESGDSGDTTGDAGTLTLQGGSSNNGLGADVLILPGNGGGGNGHMLLRATAGPNITFNTDTIDGARVFNFPNQDGFFTTSTSDIGAPATTPATIGQIYVDTSGPTVYVSTGTSTSADWTAVN